MERHETFLFDKLLAGVGKDPIAVGFDFTARLPRGIKIELARERIFSSAGDDELLGLLASSGFELGLFLGLHFAGGVADIGFALDELGDANTASTAVDVDLHVGFDLVVSLGPGSCELNKGVGSNSAYFRAFL